MLIYFSTFIFAILYYCLTAKNKASQSKLLLAIFLFSIAIFIGLGDMIGGYDRYIYGEVFDLIADTTIRGGDYTEYLIYINGQEYGYFLWQILISHITANRYIFIFITTLFMYALYYKAIQQYTKHYPLACIIFLGFFYYFTMTYLRQAIATGFIWLAVRYLWERKPIPFFGLTLLAFSFHNSALIFSFMYFIPIKKYKSHQLLIFLAICLLIGISPLSNSLLLSSGEIAQIQQRTQSYAELEMVAFRWEYLMETIVILFIILLNYSQIPHEKKTLTFLNSTIAFLGVLLMFIRFGQGGRLGWYFLIGLIYILTTFSIKGNNKHWMKSFTIILSFILFTRITFLWSFNLMPYKTFLTNGYPSGEFYIYERYEYDPQYSDNKFYR